MFTYSPKRQKNICIYKNNPYSSYAFFLMLSLHIWSKTDFFYYGCSWVSCLSRTVELPTVLQKNPWGPANSLVFQHYKGFKHSLMVQKVTQCIKSRKLGVKTSECLCTFFLFCLNIFFSFHLVLIFSYTCIVSQKTK